jgi:hypothetical protein
MYLVYDINIQKKMTELKFSIHVFFTLLDTEETIVTWKKRNLYLVI